MSVFNAILEQGAIKYRVLDEQEAKGRPPHSTLI